VTAEPVRQPIARVVLSSWWCVLLLLFERHCLTMSIGLEEL